MSRALDYLVDFALASGVAAAVSIAGHGSASAATFNVLYSFQGGNDGAYPYAGVVLAADNNLNGLSALSDR